MHETAVRPEEARCLNKQMEMKRAKKDGGGKLQGPPMPSTSSDVQSYIELFAANAPLLFFTQVLALHNRDVLWAALEMGGETHSVFKPLLRCTPSHLASNGGLFLPTDFVRGPEQSGSMFADSSEVNVRLMLTWIAFVRRHWAFELRLESGRLSQSTARIGLDIILSCPTSEVILTELQTLDLAISCREVKDLADDHALQAAHQGFHELTLPPSAVQNILTWLGRFPVVPAASVTYWEKQYSDIRVCCSVD
ncbi:hypothetical protein C8F01DRAFT_1234351 [Mycena amicta]|nr:hypothetical protein C8F01DRAFT_1234351 [Mycena amicta]